MGERKEPQLAFSELCIRSLPDRRMHKDGLSLSKVPSEDETDGMQKGRPRRMSWLDYLHFPNWPLCLGSNGKQLHTTNRSHVVT